MMEEEDAEGGMQRMIGIIDSMTSGERKNPKSLNPSRCSRIAAGSGSQLQEVNGLVKQFEVIRPILAASNGDSI